MKSLEEHQDAQLGPILFLSLRKLLTTLTEKKTKTSKTQTPLQHVIISP